MRVAVIDIGTNTVLLLVALFDATGNIIPLVYEQRVPRLGRGVDAEKNLQPESMERVITVLREYKDVISRYEPANVVVCGTSAVRDAANRLEFSELVHGEVGFDLEILSGQDEALWTYRGAISGVPNIQQAAVVDIGGGSTEISIGDSQRITQVVSLDIGSVRLTERFLKHDPPTAGELESAIEIVRRELTRASGFDFTGTTLVGVAGTATSLAIIAQGLHEFRLKAVTNCPLTKDTVSQLFRMLHIMPSWQIRNISAVMEGRSDVITAGVLILREILERFGFNEMIVSERGVRYGLAIREWERVTQRSAIQ